MALLSKLDLEDVADEGAVLPVGCVSSDLARDVPSFAESCGN